MEVAYLDIAAEGLHAPSCAEAFLRYCKNKEKGTSGHRLLHHTEAETPEMAAELLKTEKSDFAFVSSASETLYILASSLEWNPSDDNVLA